MDNWFSTDDQIDAAYDLAFKTFATRRTIPLSYRLKQLQALFCLVRENDDAIAAALKADMNRSELEAHFSDVGGLLKEIADAILSLEVWTAPEYPEAGFAFQGIGTTKILTQPLGVSLILGAWNFPLYVTFGPLVGAIGAGCCVVIKPSEVAPASAKLMADLVPKYLDPEAYIVLQGAVKETTYMLKKKWNHIFYTGAGPVGKIILRAAAEHLTPVTLELGGQAPAIITDSANIDLSAKRVISSKFTNAGQVCVAANHVFVPAAQYEEFVSRLIHWTNEFTKHPDTATKYMTHIINQRHWDRLDNLLKKTNGQIVAGGTRDRETCYFSPTVVVDVADDDILMENEIFGPIVPILRRSNAEAIKHINAHDQPLALYVFTSKASQTDDILSQTISGGAAINDTALQVGAPQAPFGGVQTSGQGSYHGKWGVLAFSHQRTIVELPTWLEKVMSFRYPPYTDDKVKAIKGRAPKMPKTYIKVTPRRGLVARLLLSGQVKLLVLLWGLAVWNGWTIFGRNAPGASKILGLLGKA